MGDMVLSDEMMICTAELSESLVTKEGSSKREDDKKQTHSHHNFTNFWSHLKAKFVFGFSSQCGSSKNPEEC